MRTDYLEAERSIDSVMFHDHGQLTAYEPDRDSDGALPAGDDLDEATASPEEAFATKLLGALAAMAVRSKRRQADLAAALRRSGMVADQHSLSVALRHLEAIGCIEDLVPLYGGGVLMSVTSRGIEQLNNFPRWTMFDTPGYRVG